MSDQLEKLLEKKSQIEAKISSIKARERKAQEKINTRKKILLGAYVMQKLDPDKITEHEFFADFEKFLTRPNDRKLFGFEKSEPEKANV